MGNQATKRKIVSSKSTITKTDYWLNVKTPLGVLGTNLATGISQHEKFISLIEKYGLDKTNKWLASKSFDAYIVRASSENSLDMSELDAEMNALD